MEADSIQTGIGEQSGNGFIVEGGLAPIQTQGMNATTLLFPLAAKPYCGDGVKQTNEQCDRNAFGGRTCQSYGLNSGSLTCSSSCVIVTSSCTGTASGDGDGETPPSGGHRGQGTMHHSSSASNRSASSARSSARSTPTLRPGPSSEPTQPLMPSSAASSASEPGQAGSATSSAASGRFASTAGSAGPRSPTEVEPRLPGAWEFHRGPPVEWREFCVPVPVLTLTLVTDTLLFLLSMPTGPSLVVLNALPAAARALIAILALATTIAWPLWFILPFGRRRKEEERKKRLRRSGKMKRKRGA